MNLDRTVTLRLEEELYDEMRLKAEAENRSLSNYILNILRERHQDDKQ